MAKIVILGAGLMGTAMTVPLSDRGHDVRLVGTHLDTDIIEEVHESRYHPRLRTHVPEGVKPYTHLALESAMQGAEVVILGVNSQGVAWAAGRLGPLLPPGIPVVMLTKGLAGDGERLQILPDLFQSLLPSEIASEIQLAAIGGPSIAGELAVRRETSIVITGTDQSLLDTMAELLRTAYYHVWTSTDQVGVEVCVAMKNLYSLAVGSVAGLLEGAERAENDAAKHNMSAALFAQSLWEIAYLVGQMGGSLLNVYALPGAGDLYVTCQGGRNTRMGRLLGQGMSYEEAKRRFMPEETIEGAELAFSIGSTIHHLVRNGTLQAEAIPLLLHMIDVVCQAAPLAFPWDAFFVRR
jgi:glycerol-3-phosphate dehydrogenase (NAD(P)+)